jgi:malic enzyme
VTFVEAVKEELPGVCLQWEDFASVHASPILQRCRDGLLVDSRADLHPDQAVYARSDWTGPAGADLAQVVAEVHPPGPRGSALSDPDAPLLPLLTDVRRVEVDIAIAVGLEAQRAGLAPETTPEALRARVVATQWTPSYDTR